ncbi:MAG: proteasome subunit alpha [Verrucomicrobiae bacterium]|nr:proteasome subunit alpha [Verrucomicrobiae bacterium]
MSNQLVQTHGTTILAIKYKDGVLVAGDRRATAGNLIMYDRADKVLPLDKYSVLAISGAPGVATEMSRVLQHSFKYYRRSQLQELSLAGKVRSLSKLLRDNMPMALQGVGIVVPIYACYDLTGGNDGGGKVFFYDALGAQFEAAEYATTGSGSMAVRSVLFYLNNWGPKPLAKMVEGEAILTALRLLNTAAESDNATGGYNPKSNVFPNVKLITRDGARDVPEVEMAKLYKQKV